MQARLQPLTLNSSPKGEGLPSLGSPRILYDFPLPSKAVGRGGVLALGGYGLCKSPVFGDIAHL
jgi:hypothetical protein